MEEYKTKTLTEYIFAPFNTFIYLNIDAIRLKRMGNIKSELLDYLNKTEIFFDKGDTSILWTLEDSKDFKISKGVFTPPGEDTSFVMAQLNTGTSSCCPIKEQVTELFNTNSLEFADVKFYFSNSGVGTCSVHINIKSKESIAILQLEKISEKLNTLFKDYFEEICFILTKKYVEAINQLNIPQYEFEFLPDITTIDRSKHFIPWTHRIYHIHDDNLISHENPGTFFKTLVTPSRKMDIEDLSIYDNRYVYFGWGHSLIFTSSQEDGYSQTTKPVYDYVRLVEIAQAQWQFLDILKDIVIYTNASYNQHHNQMGLSDISLAINEIRRFDNAVDRLIADYTGVKITFDTEKRILLNELHERWLTQSMLESLQSSLERMQNLLDQLYQRQKEQQEESLNTIVLLFTILGVIDVLAIFFDIISPDITFTPLIQIITLIIGTLVMAIAIKIYLGYATRG